MAELTSGATAAPAVTPARDRPSLVPGIPRRQLRAAGIGNLIEWFDWNAYALLSVYFAGQFFPAGTSPLVALLGTFGIMAVGFIARPLAGLVLGTVADRFGRKPALLLTVYGMGVSSLLIAFAPTYAQVGLVAPLILLVARIVQGICIGGEYASMSAFAMEMAPQGRRGFIAGVLNAVAGFGQIAVAGLVLLLSWTLPHEAMTAWGWRLVFVVGALLSVAGIWLRRDMHETIDARRSRAGATGMFAAMRRYPGATVRVVGLTIGFTAMVYAWGTYMPTYATTYRGFDPKLGMVAMVVSTVVAMVGALVAGRLSDRFGRRPTMVAAGVLLTVGTVPALALINHSVWSLIAVQGFGMLTLSLLQASSMPAYTEMFPADFRAAGLGFPYALTVGLIGGTVPMVGTQLASVGLPTAFPWYLVVLMAISTVFYLTMKETAFEPLPD
ncbi:MFS transporter [Tersicoccus sp. Bi-70]|uniref:MFS transporter n=1 Tax=Tersicoccus sp. Bi-70 TaxID=1897634 RepID=UPI000976BB50|nr:MFS transporter [Tersicoccus sp. Bi-70]OMH34876.1 hypothetical protein BGP79_00460 [Tersicoccus sp. Bi-70]